MVVVKCFGYWISLGKTRQWMRIAVSLRITGLCAGLLEFAALAKALALGGDPTPPS